MSNYYLSKNYRHLNTAGDKAKTDVEKILEGLGYTDAGLPRTMVKSGITAFFITLAGVLKIPFTVSRGDLVIVQYPLKKFYALACALVHLKEAKVITLVHDLGSFRRKRVTILREIIRLSRADVLIVHNGRMKEWLSGQGYRKPMVCLEVFDFLSDSTPSAIHVLGNPYSVVYAGWLSHKKNPFLYLLDSVSDRWRFILYGKGFDTNRIRNKDAFRSKGFVRPDELISSAEGDFGLVWDGESIDTCSGAFGEYLRYNNPHKLSLYLRCNLPVIIWKEAAMASFVANNGVGICVDSLRELSVRLHEISPEEYHQMQRNAKAIGDRLAVGYYFSKALSEAEAILSR